MCLNVLLKVGSVTFYFVIFHFLLSIFYTTHCLPCLPLLGDFSGRFHSKVHKMCSDGQLVLSDFCVEMSDLSQIIWPKMTEFPISNVSGRCQGQSLRHRWLRPINVSLTAVKQKDAEDHDDCDFFTTKDAFHDLFLKHNIHILYEVGKVCQVLQLIK